jgi:hypothetical protein
MFLIIYTIWWGKGKRTTIAVIWIKEIKKRFKRQKVRKISEKGVP